MKNGRKIKIRMGHIWEMFALMDAHRETARAESDGVIVVVDEEDKVEAYLVCNLLTHPDTCPEPE